MKKDYFFHQDRTHPDGNLVTLKIVGLSEDEYKRLQEFVENLATGETPFDGSLSIDEPWGMECDVCGKPATVNVQECVVRWRHDRAGKLIPEVLCSTDNYSYFYCDEHEDHVVDPLEFVDRL